MASEAALREYCIDQIHHQGFISVEFGVSGADIDPLFTTFRGVLDEVYGQKTQRGQDVLDAFAVIDPMRPHDSKGFIEQRRVGEISVYEGRSPGTDNKDVLHFTPLSAIQVRDHLRTRGGTPKIVDSLINQCMDFHEAIKASVTPVLKILGLDQHMVAPEGDELLNVHLLRIIRYIGTRASDENVFIARDELAELHLDRSKMTAAVWESYPGLVGAPANNQIGDPNLTVEQLDAYAEQALANPITHHSGFIKLFAGAGYNHLPQELQDRSGNLPPLLHGVTNEVPEGEERDAVVFFMNQTTRYNHWTPTATQETGFGDIRAAVEERQAQHGGLVAS